MISRRSLLVGVGALLVTPSVASAEPILKIVPKSSDVVLTTIYIGLAGRHPEKNTKDDIIKKISAAIFQNEWEPVRQTSDLDDADSMLYVMEFDFLDKHHKPWGDSGSMSVSSEAVADYGDDFLYNVLDMTLDLWVGTWGLKNLAAVEVKFFHLR